MPNLQKIINLIKKTGDKAIILDENGEVNYVIMTLSDYERLVLGKAGVAGLTEDEFLDKINRDIEIWKESKSEPEIGHLPLDQYDFSRKLEADGGGYLKDRLNLEEKEEDQYYFEPVE
ncbi:hypothetical protein HZA71_00450 [Candidatus Falkowbacteria bacterium]|nr:hypothetical protein [Candidatus Falkowbacteria bacterium]